MEGRDRQLALAELALIAMIVGLLLAPPLQTAPRVPRVACVIILAYIRVMDLVTIKGQGLFSTIAYWEQIAMIAVLQHAH
ncbi:hypothetical protein AAMO2058_000596700 [Amorphochlora amoebiformis]